MNEPGKCECCGAPLHPDDEALCDTCLDAYMESGGNSPAEEDEEDDDDDDE